MQDPVLHFLAWCVLAIDLMMLIGAVLLAYLLFRYRREITMFYQWLKDERAARVSR